MEGDTRAALGSVSGDWAGACGGKRSCGAGKVLNSMARNCLWYGLGVAQVPYARAPTLRQVMFVVLHRELAIAAGATLVAIVLALGAPGYSW